jgi:hypothetical protein
MSPSNRSELFTAIGLTLAIILSIVVMVEGLYLLLPEEQYTGFRFFAGGLGLLYLAVRRAASAPA